MNNLIEVLNNIVFHLFLFVMGETEENVWEQFYHDNDTGWNRTTTLALRHKTLRLYYETLNPNSLEVVWKSKRKLWVIYSSWKSTDWCGSGLHIMETAIYEERSKKLSGLDYGWFPEDRRHFTPGEIGYNYDIFPPF